MLDQPDKRDVINRFVILLQSVLEARKRVMVEVNVSQENLDEIIDVLPAMRKPTVSSLHDEKGYAVKAAVQRKKLPRLVPRIKQKGGTDVVVSELSQLIT